MEKRFKRILFLKCVIKKRAPELSRVKCRFNVVQWMLFNIQTAHSECFRHSLSVSAKEFLSSKGIAMKNSKTTFYGCNIH